MKILYIEDSPEHIRTVQRVALDMGHELVTAGTGKDGLTFLANPPPDLILIDIHLPDINGLDLVRQIRRNHYLMPIIALTGDVWTYNEQISLQAGCNGFLAKPCGIETLREVFSQFDSRTAT